MQTIELAGYFAIDACFYSPCCNYKCTLAEAKPTLLDNGMHDYESVIQNVCHPSSDLAAEISSLEAEKIQQELWASRIDMREATLVQQSNALLLLTFARQTPELEQALLASRLAANAAWVVKPDWARGAKIFTNIEPQALMPQLPSWLDLKPWHVVVHEADESSLAADIAHLAEPVRRLKHGIGRTVLWLQDADSVHANADMEFTRTESESSNASFFSCFSL